MKGILWAGFLIKLMSNYRFTLTSLLVFVNECQHVMCVLKTKSTHV